MEITQSRQERSTQSGMKTDSLYHAIRERICLLQYQPGMALREEALAAEYGVSRTPIRNVLQRLEHEGLVAHPQGSGFIVTTIDLRQLKDVYELRLKLAEFVGDMMFGRTPPQTIAILKDLHHQCREMRDNFDVIKIAKLYENFNEIMLGTISNRPLRQMSDQLFHQTSRVWLDILPELDWQQEVDMVCEEISDVIRFLNEGDIKMAASVRRNHMSMLLQRINRYLGSADDQPF